MAFLTCNRRISTLELTQEQKTENYAKKEVLEHIAAVAVYLPNNENCQTQVQEHEMLLAVTSLLVLCWCAVKMSMLTECLAP